MGAPRKNPPANALQLIEEFAAQGFAIIGIAKRLGVTRETFKRWCEEDCSLQEAFEMGRETQKQALIALITEAAKLNKGANANAMFLLKTMHGFREFDSPTSKVDVTIVPNVMVVVDHGTDEQWAAKVAAQQRALTTANSTAPRQIEASIPVHVEDSAPNHRFVNVPTWNSRA